MIMGKIFAALIFITVAVFISGVVAMLHVGAASAPLGVLGGGVAFIIANAWYERYGRP